MCVCACDSVGGVSVRVTVGGCVCTCDNMCVCVCVCSGTLLPSVDFQAFYTVRCLIQQWGSSWHPYTPRGFPPGKPQSQVIQSLLAALPSPPSPHISVPRFTPVPGARHTLPHLALLLLLFPQPGVPFPTFSASVPQILTQTSFATDWTCPDRLIPS